MSHGEVVRIGTQINTALKIGLKYVQRDVSPLIGEVTLSTS